MSNVSTFSAYTTAKLGIYAAQKGLDITGQNISNINTKGYTREALTQVSLRTGGKDRYTSSGDAGIGTGALVTGVSQLRDPFLDIRFRNEQAGVGSLSVKLSVLDQLTGILDEVGDNDGAGILEAQFNDLTSQLQDINTEHATENEYESLVRSSANSLVKLFNNYAERLQQVSENESESLEQDISDVNDIFKELQTLNDDIQTGEIHGDNCLELKNQRNMLLDNLSSYMKVDITYQAVSVGAGSSVDKLVVKTAGNPARTLVDGGYVTQISLRETTPQLNPDYTSTSGAKKYLDADGNPTDDLLAANMVADTNYDFDLSALKNANDRTLVGSADVCLSDTELAGSLQASREILTEKGEFTTAGELLSDPNAAGKRGIPYYQKALDALAGKFAAVLNEANTGYLKDADGFYLSRSDSGVWSQLANVDGSAMTLSQMSDVQKATLVHPDRCGALFSNGKDSAFDPADTSYDASITAGITAANISISGLWNAGGVRLQNSYVQGAGKTGAVNSSDNSNLVHMIALMDSSQVYKPSETITGRQDADNAYFEGSFQQMLTNIQTTLAQDSKSTNTLLDNYTAAASTLDTSREAVSGVDLNDEAMSLMTYQKSYAAACRLMTALDEALGKLLNM